MHLTHRTNTWSMIIAKMLSYESDSYDTYACIYEISDKICLALKTEIPYYLLHMRRSPSHHPHDDLPRILTLVQQQ